MPPQTSGAVNTDGSITVTWARRTRIGGNLQDFTGTVPLNETTESYEVYLLEHPFDGDLSGPYPPTDLPARGSDEHHRSAVTYLPASTAEFDVNLDTLTVVVYQVSATVGRGFPGVRSIEPWHDLLASPLSGDRDSSTSHVSRAT
jgi:hypothetical protein